MSLSVLFALQILWVNVHVALSQNPLIVQHGISGSIIEVQGENAEIPLLCPRTFSRRRLWLDIEQAFILRCFKAAIRLNGVDAEGNGRFPTGLSGGVPSDGIFATSCIDPSDAISCSLTRYLRDFYDFLVSRGYVLGRTLDAVPYDWRFSPIDFKQQGNYFSRLKERVERMFDETGKKVTILGHSMGSATTTLFLNSYVTQEWKDKYVRMFISVVGAIGGSVAGLKQGLIGERETIFSASTVAEIISTFPGVHSLIPANAPDSMVYGSEPLFVLGNESFNVNNLPDLYRRFGLNDFADVLNELRGQYQVPPGVRTHCIFGRGFDTVTKVTIPDPNDLDDFTEEFEDGDKTLTLESQKVCANFASRQSQPVTTETFTASHTAIIRDRSSVWDHILDMINDDPLTSHHIFLEIASASCLLANVLVPLLLLSYSLY